MSMTLDQSYQRCRQVARQAASSFYPCFRVLPEPKRQAMVALYAFFRQTDDITDDDASLSVADRRQRLAEWRVMLEATLAGESPHEFSPALRDAVARYAIPPKYLYGAIDGAAMDLEHIPYESIEELLTYCYRVASTVGLACIHVWGFTDDRAIGPATQCGYAFQLTNILRDFGEDFDAGRVYIPNEDFERHGLSATDVRRWTRPDACQRFMLEQIDRCDGYYQKSAGLEELITPSCRPTLWAMSSIYRGLLVKMHRNPARVVAPSRLRLSSLHKGMIAFKARWLARSMSESPVKRWNDTPSRISGD
jgi:phytoene synthase